MYYNMYISTYVHMYTTNRHIKLIGIFIWQAYRYWGNVEKETVNCAWVPVGQVDGQATLSNSWWPIVSDCEIDTDHAANLCQTCRKPITAEVLHNIKLVWWDWTAVTHTHTPHQSRHKREVYRVQYFKSSCHSNYRHTYTQHTTYVHATQQCSAAILTQWRLARQRLAQAARSCKYCSLGQGHRWTCTHQQAQLTVHHTG